MSPPPQTATGTAAANSVQSDDSALERLRTLSTLLDSSFRIPGTNIRFGIDPILGILPVAGDAVSSLISLYIILEGYRAGASQSVLAKMLALAAVDFVAGSIPVIGPVFDAVWKSNEWSVTLLEEHLEQTRKGIK